MTERLRDNVSIPVWAVTLLSTLFLTALIFIINITANNARNIGSITTSIFEVNKRLDRIENKIEIHITNEK